MSAAAHKAYHMPSVQALSCAAMAGSRKLRMGGAVATRRKLKDDAYASLPAYHACSLRPNATFRFWIPDTRFCREDDQNLVSGVLKCPQPGYLRASGIQNFEASGNLIPHFQVCSHPPCCLAATTCRLPGGSVASLWVPHVSWPLLSAAVAIAVLSRQPVLINSYHRGGVGCCLLYTSPSPRDS